MKSQKKTELDKELLNIDNTSEHTSKQDSLINYEEIEGTPFTIATVDKVHFGMIANARITEGYDNIEELKEEVTKITWNRLTQVIWIMAEKLIEKKGK